MQSRAASFFFAGLMLGVLASTVGFAFFLRSNRTQQDQQFVRTLKLAHGLDPAHPVHQAMEHLARRLEDLSAGRMKLMIFPNGQLGSETECIEQLQRGALAMTKTSTAPLESFVSEIAIFGVPYAFRDGDHFWRFAQHQAGRDLLAAGQRVGLRGLCYYDAGSRNFYTVDRPILAPADLKGLKIRVQQSQTAIAMVEALGGSPTPIAWGELYTALQQRMVDGAENNPPSFYTNRHFEVCKHLSMDEHARVPDMLLISQPIWETLSEQEQSWLQSAADESSLYQRQLWEQESNRVLQSIEAEGVQVHYPDKRAFAEQVRAMHAGYRGTPVGHLLDIISEL